MYVHVHVHTLTCSTHTVNVAIMLGPVWVAFTSQRRAVLYVDVSLPVPTPLYVA